MFASIANSLLRATTACSSVAADLYAFWSCLWYYWMADGSYQACPHFQDNLHARVHVSSVAFINRLWSMKHYRHGDFQADLVENLRNVAFPNTGLPLSFLCFHRYIALTFIVIGYPFLALYAAIFFNNDTTVGEKFREHLLQPTNWFSFWRLNCRLASLHANKHHSPGYACEDKWSFLQMSNTNDVPVPPQLSTTGVVCKHRNEEGGMGIHVFKSAAMGGDWIIEKPLFNSDAIAQYLPENAPLSTLRVITCSRGSFTPKTLQQPASADMVTALSCVWRAGRSGATTDHSSILYNVDIETGEIGVGTTNNEWYQLGASHLKPIPPKDLESMRKPQFTAHPDSNKEITGKTIKDIVEIKELVKRAHSVLCPDVPLCGWDVALSTDGMFLLEVNLSCNFFCGDFDLKEYFKFIDHSFRALETAERTPTPNGSPTPMKKAAANGSPTTVKKAAA